MVETFENPTKMMGQTTSWCRISIGFHNGYELGWSVGTTISGTISTHDHEASSLAMFNFSPRNSALSRVNHIILFDLSMLDPLSERCMCNTEHLIHHGGQPEPPTVYIYIYTYMYACKKYKY